MFDRTQYVIERPDKMLGRPRKIRGINGDILGFIKFSAFGGSFPLWFEDSSNVFMGKIRREAIHNLSEISKSGLEFKVFGPPKQLRGIVRSTGQVSIGPSKDKITSWQLEDPNGQPIAVAKLSRDQMRKPDYSLISPDGKPICKVHGISSSESYQMDLLSPGLDALLFLGFGVCVSYYG